MNKTLNHNKLCYLYLIKLFQKQPHLGKLCRKHQKQLDKLKDKLAKYTQENRDIKTQSSSNNDGNCVFEAKSTQLSELKRNNFKLIFVK